MCCSFTCFSSLPFKPGTLFLHRCLKVLKTVQRNFSSLYCKSQSRQHLERKKAQAPHTLQKCVTEVMVWSGKKEADGYFVCLPLRSVTKTESWKATVLSVKNLSEVLTENMAEKKNNPFPLSTFATKNKGRTEKSCLLFPPHTSPLNLTQDFTKNPHKSQENHSSCLSSKSLVPLVKVGSCCFNQAKHIKRGFKSPHKGDKSYLSFHSTSPSEGNVLKEDNTLAWRQCCTLGSELRRCLVLVFYWCSWQLGQENWKELNVSFLPAETQESSDFHEQIL